MITNEANWPSVVSVMGVDPGLHVGVAHVILTRNKPGTEHPLIGHGYTIMAHSTATLSGEDQYLTGLRTNLGLMRRVYAPDLKIVACEQFIFTRTSMTGQQKDALLSTGVLKAWVHDMDDPDLFDTYTQKPSEAKQLVTNDVLKELKIKMYGDKKSDHELMAARHALLMAHRFTNRKFIPTR